MMALANGLARPAVKTASRRHMLGIGAAAVGLAACGPAAGSSSTAAAPTSAISQATAAPVRQPQTIDVLTRAGVSAASGHSQFFDKRAKAIFTPETKITVNLIDAQPDVGQKLTVMAAGGTVPDGSWFGVLADGVAGREQAANGIFKPLDPFISKDTKFDVKPYFKSMTDAFTVAGKLYALPIHGHFGTTVLYYNKNLTKAAGITVPDDGNWTIDDLILAAQKIVKKDQDIWGYFSPWGFPEFGTFYLRQFGGEWIDEPGKKALLDSPESRAGLQWVYDVQAKAQTIDSLYHDPGPDVLFTQGKLGFVNWTPGFVAQWKAPGPDQISPANGKFELGVAHFPKGPNGRRGTQASGSGMGMTGTAKQEAVWEYLKFVTSKDNGVEQVFGGAGSPGGRADVWADAKLLSFDPIYSTILKAFAQGPGQLRLPANNRFVDLLKVTGDELPPFFKGQTGVGDATGKAAQAINTLLSQ